MLKPLFQRFLLVRHLVVYFIQVFDASWHHECIVPAIGHVLKALFTELCDLVPPGKEGRLISELAGLVISCDNLE